MRLNLGAGDTIIPGYERVELRDGKQAFPLSYPDGSAEVIRASHLLEHFSYHQTVAVLQEWLRVLKPGGWLKIAVPDFDWIVNQYQQPIEKDPQNLEGFLLGGHHAPQDAHLAIFNEQKLRDLFGLLGLVNVRRWQSEIPDCASLPVSLNLEAQKPNGVHHPKCAPLALAAAGSPLPVAGASSPSNACAPAPVAVAAGRNPAAVKIGACMSVPRFGFQAHFLCCIEAMQGMDVRLRQVTGAYWGHCMEQCMVQSLADAPELLLTLDYDTLFKRADLEAMIRLMLEHPEVDALAPVQAHRSAHCSLWTIRDEKWRLKTGLTNDQFAGPLTEISTAHFGLTLFRAAKFAALKHPWFQDAPAADGQWGEGCIDDDIGFWRAWTAAGNTVYLANRVAVGHIEELVRWPGVNMGPIHQELSDWVKSGKPQEAWK